MSLGSRGSLIQKKIVFLFPEFSLALEVLKPFCTTLFMVAVFAFVKEVSPMTTTSTVEAVFGALYFGAGRGLGGLLGGVALEFLGSDQTFRYLN